MYFLHAYVNIFVELISTEESKGIHIKILFDIATFPLMKIVLLHMTTNNI